MPVSTVTPSRTRWYVFIAVLVADVLDLLDATVTNIAAPSIVRQLHASPGLVPWLGLSYSLALGSLLVVGGRLGDRLGARRTFLLGLTGFGIAAAGVAAAPGPVSLIACRLVQGCFGALLIPQGFTILLRVFPRDEIGRVVGLFGPLMALSSISGPVLAALLLQAAPLGLGWRAVFLLISLLGAALLVLGIAVLPAIPGDRDARIAVLPSGLVMGGLLAVLGGVIAGGDSGWKVPQIALTVVGAFLLAGFVITQRRATDPLLAPALFRTRSFVAGITVGSLFFAAVSGLLYLTSLFLQTGLRVAVLPTAALMAPLSIGIIATSFSLRSRVQRLGRRLVVTGVLVTAVGVGAYLAMAPMIPSTPWLVTMPLLVTGLGMGCCFGSVFATALGDVAPDQAGSASGTLNALQQVANAVGAALVATVFLSLAADGPAAIAVQLSLVAVLCVLVVCAATVPLLPVHAVDDRR